MAIAVVQRSAGRAGCEWRVVESQCAGAHACPRALCLRPCRCSSLSQTVVCLLPIWLATWIGLTRIVDFWHNFDDVSIGALLGFSIASLTFQLHVSTDRGDEAQLRTMHTGAASTAGGLRKG